MKCQKCDKPATFHITELSGGTPQEVHLCEGCAREYLSSETPETPSDVSNLAGALAQQLALGETAEQLSRLEQKTCPICGITFLEFRKSGRLGCPNDYDFFWEQLEPLLVNIHGESRHAGKVPQRSGAAGGLQTELIRLRREMKDAVQDEDYERASELRDEIRRLETDLG